MSVAHIRERLDMSTATPQDRVRASIALTVTDEMADRLLQHDKANPAFRLADLRDEDERAVFRADILELLSPERRAERAIRLNAIRAHTHAAKEDEHQMSMRQARQDIARFGAGTDGHGSHFGAVRPGYCVVCHKPVVTDGATVLITEHLRADAHGLCCAMDAGERFELIAEFSYRMKGGTDLAAGGQ